MQNFLDEAALMKTLRPHVNIVTFLGITLSPDPICIVTEFLSQGSLHSYLKTRPLEGEALKKVVEGIAAGKVIFQRLI